MPEDRCLLDPKQECYGRKRAEEVASDVRALDQKLTIFQQSATETINKFGGRIGKLEAHNEVQDEQMKQIKETQKEIKREVEEARKEQKNSISELRLEHRESMDELKKSNAAILEAVTPLKHKVDSMEEKQKGISSDVDEMKAKPGKTWDDVKLKILFGILAVFATALGYGIIRLLVIGS